MAANKLYEVLLSRTVQEQALVQVFAASKAEAQRHAERRADGCDLWDLHTVRDVEVVSVKAKS